MLSAHPPPLVQELLLVKRVKETGVLRIFQMFVVKTKSARLKKSVEMASLQKLRNITVPMVGQT